MSTAPFWIGKSTSHLCSGIRRSALIARSRDGKALLCKRRAHSLVNDSSTSRTAPHLIHIRTRRTTSQKETPHGEPFINQQNRGTHDSRSHPKINSVEGNPVEDSPLQQNRDGLSNGTIRNGRSNWTEKELSTHAESDQHSTSERDRKRSE